MSDLSGKTVSVLDRLPHFFKANEVGPTLLEFVDLFGHQLDDTEADGYRVLRAHHVEQADNQGFQGYTAPPEKRGDLDKIFALYLEALGGTALLVKTSPRFTSRSVNVPLLAQRFNPDDVLGAYLTRTFAVALYSLYQKGDPDAKTDVFAIVTDEKARDLLNQKDPGAWRVIRDAVYDVVRRYSVQYALVTPEELTSDFVLQLLLAQDSTSEYIFGRLSPQTRNLLGAYTGSGTLDATLRIALARDLNTLVLRDPGLFQENQDEFLLAPTKEPYATISDDAAALVRSIYRDELRVKYSAEPDVNLRQQLLDLLDHAEPVSIPAGDDQVRLNRMLLEFAFDGDFEEREIALASDVRDVLVRVLNRLLDDADLFTPGFFPEVADDFPTLQRQYGADMVGLNRLLLESVFPNEIETSYAPYRDRLLGLIQVLRQGASTRQGIIDIVAANLGIIGDDPQTQAAKALIEIEEFNPKRTSFFSGNLALYQTFQVNNTNPHDVTPEIWVTMLSAPPGSVLAGLENIRFEDLGSAHTATVSVQIKPRDNLVIKQNEVTLNTLAVQQGQSVSVPTLPPGTSNWQFTADINAEGATRPAGRFDDSNTPWDKADFTPDAAVINATVQSYVDTPGVFTVVIPWHIPGYTDKFEETPDHPRNQILELVNKVRAAGVKAYVAYKQSFAEEHVHQDQLNLVIKGDGASNYLLAERLDLADNLRASNTERSGEDHDMGDALSLDGRFDVTYFDSLNGFAR